MFLWWRRWYLVRRINKEGEFVVACHGVGGGVTITVNMIVNSYLKAGPCQVHENVEDLNNPGHKCEKGVYLSPDINVADGFANELFIGEIKKNSKLLYNVEQFLKKSENL